MQCCPERITKRAYFSSVQSYRCGVCMFSPCCVPYNVAREWRDVEKLQHALYNKPSLLARDALFVASPAVSEATRRGCASNQMHNSEIRNVFSCFCIHVINLTSLIHILEMQMHAYLHRVASKRTTSMNLYLHIHPCKLTQQIFTLKLLVCVCWCVECDKFLGST